MARKTEKLKTIFAVVLESLASNISAIIGGYNSQASLHPVLGLGLAQPSWHVQLMREP